MITTRNINSTRYTVKKTIKQSLGVQKLLTTTGMIGSFEKTDIDCFGVF